MLFNPVTLVGKDGKLLPIIKFVIQSVLCLIFFVMGWIGHMNWSHRAEADQLISDANVAMEIREESVIRTDILKDNIYHAVQVEQTECNCGDATDIDFMLKLRENREKRSKFDKINPF